MLKFLVMLLGLVGSTLAIVAIDKKVRHNQVFEGYEVQWNTVVLLAIFLNIVTLPYYFGRTRGRARWAFFGSGMFVVCIIFMIGAGGVIVAIERRPVARHLDTAASPEIVIDKSVVDGVAAQLEKRSAKSEATGDAGGKPPCCDLPLVASMKGHRWTPRSGFVKKSSFYPEQLDYFITDEALSLEIGCGSLLPTSGHVASWSAKRQKRVVLGESSLWMSAHDKAKDDQDNDSLNIADGEITFGAIKRNHQTGSLNVQYDDDTWAVGTFEFTVCKL